MQYSVRNFILYRFTYLQSFKDLLKQFDDQAIQHEIVAEKLNTSVVQELFTQVKELKEDRREVMH